LWLRWWNVAAHVFAAFENHETIIAETPWRSRPSWCRHGAFEAMRAAMSCLSGRVEFQVPTRNMDRCLAPEFIVVFEDFPEIDALRMAKKPGGIVILISLDRGDSHGEIERPTLSAKAATWRWCHGSPASGTREKDCAG
jgi:hypothetical protein